LEPSAGGGASDFGTARFTSTCKHDDNDNDDDNDDDDEGDGDDDMTTLTTITTVTTTTTRTRKPLQCPPPSRASTSSAASTHRLAVDGVHARLENAVHRVLVLEHNEAEAPALARLTVVHHLRGRDSPELAEVQPQLRCETGQRAARTVNTTPHHGCLTSTASQQDATGSRSDGRPTHTFASAVVQTASKYLAVSGTAVTVSVSVSVSVTVRLGARDGRHRHSCLGDGRRRRRVL
jgi:hypothetical protein